jgi:predicted Rossmann fold nucleotide-binding protein DprA/Smf involved in DNA uptake
MPTKIAIDLAALEDLAARGLNVGAAARELWLKPGTLTSRIYGDADVKAAWRRGQMRSPGRVASQTAGVSDGERRVLEAVAAGRRTCAAIKQATALRNSDFMTAIERLEIDGRIKSRDVRMLTNYYLRDEEFTASAPLQTF